MTKQTEYHAYLDGLYQGVFVATEDQLAEMGLTVGDAPKPNIDALRVSASVPRADFCNGLADIGLLKDDEAVAAAKGAWPAPMDVFLKYLDDRQRRDVQIEWATRATVERNHWAVLAMISFGIATEAQADTLCGITEGAQQ